MISELIDIATGKGDRLGLLPIFRLWDNASPAARSAVLGALKDDMPEVLEALRASGDTKDARALHQILLETASNLDDAPAIDLRDPSLREALDASLALAASKLPAEQTDEILQRILEAAPWPGAKLREWLEDNEAHGHMTLRTAARKRPDSWLDANAVALLGSPALAGVASNHIANSGTPESRTTWLTEWHLLMSRGRRRALLRQMGDAGVIETAMTPTDDPAARRGGAIWLVSLTRNPEKSTAALASCFTDASASVRHVAARGLRRNASTAETDSALLDFAFDPDPRVAEAAASGLTEARSLSRDEHLRDSYRALARSPHPRVRRVAGAALDRCDPETAILNSDALSCPIAARRQLARDRAGFVGWLKELGSSDTVETRLRAFNLADRLCVLDDLEAEIIRSIRSTDDYLVSRAALLIGNLKGPGPDAALRYTLAHASHRVRANAVEAFSRRADREDQLTIFLHDNAARVRANTVRHFLRAGGRSLSPDSVLAEMLSDPRPGHRISALWAAQSGVALSLAGRIDDMSKTDPDANVVVRARKCSGYLGRLIRSGWASSTERENQPLAAPTVVSTQRRRVG